MQKLSRKTRSFSQTSLQETVYPNSNPKKAAKVKLTQLKKAKEKIEKVLHSDLQQFQIVQENFHNKKDYFSNKESSIISDLFETNRLYNAEKNRFQNPLSILLSDDQAQKAFFQTLKQESLRIQAFFRNKNSKNRFFQLNQDKIQSFHSFFKAKEDEIKRREETSMLKEDIQGKIMRNLEYAFSLEECETKLFEAKRALADLRKDSMILNLSGELPDNNLTYKEKKSKRNELVFNLKVSDENLRVLTGELECLRRKVENLKKFIDQVETENNMPEFEENLIKCLSETRREWFLNANQKVFGYREMFIEGFDLDYETMQEQQKTILDQIRMFPGSNNLRNEVSEVLMEGSKKNKHFKDNLAVFFEAKQDICQKAMQCCQLFQKKVKNVKSERIRKNELLSELDECERSILLIEAENNRSHTNPQNIIKIKDLLLVSSQEKELLSVVERYETETANITEKRGENQKWLSEQLILVKKNNYSGKENVLKAISSIYQILVEEKSLIEELKENQPNNFNNSVEFESIFELFYTGLNRNFSLLESQKQNQVGAENSAENLDLYRQKLDFLSNRLEKTKSEHLQEMCMLNEKILSQQLKIEKDEERIRTLERFINNLKIENGIKTTQNTRKTEEEEIMIYPEYESSFNLEKNLQKNRHNSFSLVKPCENASRFGNVSINLQVSQESNSQETKKNPKLCDFPLQITTKKRVEKKSETAKGVDLEIEIFKLNANDKSSDVSKPRILKLFYQEKKLEVWKKYKLAAKEKVTVENSFLISDLKRYEVEVYLRKNTKEAVFKFEVSLMGLLKIKIKEYQEAKNLKKILKSLGVEKKEPVIESKEIKKMR